jgi:hypothetical protein
MPAQTGKSSLFGKLSQDPTIKKAVQAHKDDTSKLGGGRLPGGITNGVAKLAKIERGTYKSGDNQGKDYMRCVGVVVKPLEHDGAPVHGLQTSVMYPMCPTTNSKGEPATTEDNVKRFLDFLRTFGIDTSSGDLAAMEPDVLAMIEEEPHFRFSTEQSKASPEYPNPKVFENWYDVVPAPTDVDAEQDMTRDNSAKAQTNGSTAASKPAAAAPASDELDALLAKANDDDKKAQNKLIDLAEAEGIDRDEAIAMETYELVIDAIREKRAGGGGGEAFKPEVGTVYEFFPLAKNGKPVKNPVDGEVTKVYAKTETVDIKNLETDAVVKGVKWDALTVKAEE